MNKQISKYPSISQPTDSIESMYQCILTMRQVLNLLIINATPPLNPTPLSSAAEVFATQAEMVALQQRVTALGG